MTQDIYSLADGLVDETATVMPVLATYAGVPGHEHRWNDFTADGARREHGVLEDQLRRVRELPPSDDPEAETARRIVESALEDEVDQYRHEEYLGDLNSLASSFQDLRQTFDLMQRETHEDWWAIADRLLGLPIALHAYGTRLEEGRQRGRAVPARQVREGIRQARNHAGDRSFFLSLPGEFAATGIEDDRLWGRIEGSIEPIRAAYDGFADYLERAYLPDAPEKDAVGEERYVRLARRFLGTSLDPQATYTWGWSEVERLRRRMEETAGLIRPGASLAEALEILQTDPERAAPSQEAFREAMLERQRIALRELDGVHFDVPEPIKTVDVRLTPPGDSLGAYYVGPSEDFSRSGCVWFSLGDKQVVPMFDQVSTAYHEGFPGHHLQNGFQVAGGGRLTRYQKLLVWYPGTGEGWALYAEDFMEELGYLERPDYVMGKLASEMLRAARVVIDIGSHLELPIPEGQPFHPGEPWSFETGVEMLMRYAAQDRPLSEAEMNRYLGWPGQAISYKVGQQVIRDLRADARRRHGEAFDPKAFHARMLDIGSVGIDVLREHMAAF